MTSASQDTEITLGTGKMLGLFFALVVICAVFFAMGFSVGKNTAKSQGADSVQTSVTGGGVRPSPAKPAAQSQNPQADMTFYKAVGDKYSNSELTAKPAANGIVPSAAPVTDKSENPADSNSASSNAYYVQVAAVSKQEDAEALVEALNKKQYSAVATQGSSDKLFHVQVGPFTSIKEAETMRAQLLGDGYNPILKK